MFHGSSLSKHDCNSASEDLKRQKGCEADLAEDDCYEVLGYRFSRCQNYYLMRVPWVWEAIEIWNWKEKGFLPYEGSWLKQPNLYIEIIEFIDKIVSQAKSKAK